MAQVVGPLRERRGVFLGGERSVAGLAPHPVVSALLQFPAAADPSKKSALGVSPVSRQVVVEQLSEFWGQGAERVSPGLVRVAWTLHARYVKSPGMQGLWHDVLHRPGAHQEARFNVEVGHLPARGI